MRAVILAGGRGTRLRPYTTVLPKPLVPVGDRPIVERIIHQLAHHGVTDVDLCVAHLGGLIRAYLTESDATPGEVTLRWWWEDEPLGTAGALRVIPDLSGTFIVMNGDILTNLNFRSLIDYHHDRGAVLTVAMHRRQVGIDLGVIEVSDGFISAYREKPSLTYDVSMGVYVYDSRALAYLPDGPCQFPDLVQALLAAGEPVAGYHADETEWYDIGTPGELERAAARLAERPDLFELGTSDPARSGGRA